MSFQPNNLTLWAPVYPPSPSVLPVPITPVPGLPQLWGYQAVNDTMADVQNSGYFYYYADWQNAANYNQGNFLQVGDQLYCVCSDGVINLNVDTLNPITTSTVTVTIPNGSITTAKLAANAVTAAKIANGTITTTQISSTAAITGSQIAAGTITTTQISNTAAITGTQIAASTITFGNIASGTIKGTNIAAGTLAGSNLINNTISSTQLDLTTIQYVKVPMTAAQWNAMSVTPFELIPNGSMTAAIVVKEAVFVQTFGTVAYAVGGNVYLQYSAVTGIGTVPASTVVSAVDIDGMLASSSASVDGVIAVTANSNLLGEPIFISNDTDPFTTGDGTWNIHIWYSIVTL